MWLKYIVKKILNRAKEEYTYAFLAYKTKNVYEKRSSIGNLMNAPQGDYCELAVVAFNNAEVIEYQIRTLATFFVFPYRYTVFDNATPKDRANAIKKVCQRYNICYVRLPSQEFIPQGMGSYSHGIACNYLYHHFLQDSNAKYFGLLDHDIFPIQQFDISYYLEKQFFYGAKHGFYIWPGFWFMRMDFLKGKKVDFRPSIRLRGDTGASNAPTLFKDVDFSNYILVSDEKRCFEGHDDVFEWGYSFFDCGWIHCWNASNYMGKKKVSVKMQMIFHILEDKLLV